MSKKVYCSVGPVPKGQKLGSMKECADKKQIRYYGIKKIDPRLLEAAKKGSKISESRDKLAIKMVGLRGRVSRLNKEIAAEKDKKKKDALIAQLDKTKKELAEVSTKFAKADKARSQKGGSRKGSKKTSRKSSNKGSRKGSKKTSKGSKKRSIKGGSWKGSKKNSKKTSKKGSRKGSRKGSKK